MDGMQSMCIPLYSHQHLCETAAGDLFTYTFSSPAIVRDFQVLVTELTALDTADCTVAIDLDTTTAARVEKVEFTITDAIAVGTSYNAHTVATSWAPFNVDVGDKIIVEQTQAGTDVGTEAGEYVVYMFVQFYPDKWV